jgi:hypothetical protein
MLRVFFNENFLDIKQKANSSEKNLEPITQPDAQMLEIMIHKESMKEQHKRLLDLMHYHKLKSYPNVGSLFQFVPQGTAKSVQEGLTDEQAIKLYTDAL